MRDVPYFNRRAKTTKEALADCLISKEMSFLRVIVISVQEILFLWDFIEELNEMRKLGAEAATRGVHERRCS